MDAQSLAEDVSLGIAQGNRVRLYQLSTSAIETEALFAAPLGQEEEQTTCVKHLLLATTPIGGETGQSGTRTFGAGSEIFCFGLEVYVYQTATLATIFVSKADSTGYLPRSRATHSASLVQVITQVFITSLLKQAKRSGFKAVVSLFARAQDQYLFPASKENPGKHILDDRQLIKWWCKTLSPLIASERREDASCSAHILVPGLEDREIHYLLPKAGNDPKDALVNLPPWTIGYPVSELVNSTEANPRCLLPRYPDDPKGRFMDTLDLHLIGREIDRWQDVHTVKEFWERMQFRQECCAGRMVGFIWLIFHQPMPPAEADLTCFNGGPMTPGASQQPDIIAKPHDSSIMNPTCSEQKLETERILLNEGRSQLGDPVAGEAPRPIPDAINSTSKRSSVPAISPPVRTVTEEQYDGLFEVLVDLDFGTPKAAHISTTTWVRQVAQIQGWPESLDWAQQIDGRQPVEATDSTKANEAVKDQVTLLLGRKRKHQEGIDSKHTAAVQPPAPEPVRVLNSSMIRKKPKTAAAV